MTNQCETYTQYIDLIREFQLQRRNASEAGNLK